MADGSTSNVARASGELPKGFSYCPGFLDRSEEKALTLWASSLAFKHYRARGRPMRRAMVMFGFEWLMDGHRLRAAPPIPESLMVLVNRAKMLPWASGDVFNQGILTKYTHDDGIGWHTDDACFDDRVVGISLGGEAEMQFRRCGQAAVSGRWRVESGSLYVLRGPARWDFEHRVRGVKETRYSITLRHVRE